MTPVHRAGFCNDLVGFIIENLEHAEVRVRQALAPVVTLLCKRHGFQLAERRVGSPLCDDALSCWRETCGIPRPLSKMVSEHADRRSMPMDEAVRRTEHADGLGKLMD